MAAIEENMTTVAASRADESATRAATLAEIEAAKSAVEKRNGKMNSIQTTNHQSCWIHGHSLLLVFLS